MKVTSARLRTVLAAALLALAGGAAPAHAAPAAAADGCGAAPPQAPGTSTDHTLTSGDRERGYRLHLPDGYTGEERLPVVLAFHGRGNAAATTEEFSKLSTLPAIVAYPEGVVDDEGKQAWQGAPYSVPGVDDVAFAGDLLDELQAELCTDERRVYATGKSNGAGLTALLACRLSDRIAAIAPVAGAFYPGTGTGQDCAPSRPVPVLEFHGTGDTTIPYAGDADRGLPAVRDWAAGWAGRNGCEAQVPDRTTAPDITVARWTDCDRDAEVRHIAVTDGGHTWPGADSYSGGGYVTQSIEAHDVLWDFVRRYALPR
ncbi:alpha/beta hydrolase family esterase [Streptomyces coryli]|uniref:alpha/beta hydrolase family esterase n=1 Tax=Streptomyces coryli TaxID=1128680 RepID=UPI0019D0F40B|nr:PHB depolymerase family esterase [Streptomyces coryli]